MNPIEQNPTQGEETGEGTFEPVSPFLPGDNLTPNAETPLGAFSENDLPPGPDHQPTLKDLSDDTATVITPKGREVIISQEQLIQKLLEQQIDDIQALKDGLKDELDGLEEVTGLRQIDGEQVNLAQLQTATIVTLTALKLAQMFEPQIMTDPNTPLKEKEKILDQIMQIMGKNLKNLESDISQVAVLNTQQALFNLAITYLEPRSLSILGPRIPDDLKPIVKDLIQQARNIAMTSLAGELDPTQLEKAKRNMEIINEAGLARSTAQAEADEAPARAKAKTKHQERLLRIDQRKEISQAIVDFTENALNKLAEFILNEDHGLIVKIGGGGGAAIEKVLDTLTTPIVAGTGLGLGVGGLVAGSFLVGEIATIPPSLTIYLSAGISAIIGGLIGKRLTPDEPSLKSELQSRLGRTELITVTP
jgi:hypothetical protein